MERSSLFIMINYICLISLLYIHKSVVWSFTIQRKRINIRKVFSTALCSTEGVIPTASYKIQKEGHILCPPLPPQSLLLGEEVYPLEALPELSITRLSLDPNIFLLRNFLSSPDDQIAMIMSAVDQGMEYSGTSSGDVVSQRFKSYTSWIYPEDDDQSESDLKETEKAIEDADDFEGSDFQQEGRNVARYMTELSSFLFFPDYYKQQNEDGKTNQCIAEAVQVVRYEVGGKYDMHHDGYNRFVTVLCYLNGVAGTWFPYAIVDDEEYEKNKNENYQDIPDFTMDTVAKDKTPGKDGLLVVGGLDYEESEDTTSSSNHNRHNVKIYPGDAIAFYSYDWIETEQEEKSDATTTTTSIGISTTENNEDSPPPPTGPFMNYRSLHTGMTAEKQEKWIATNWFRMSPENS